MLERFTARVEWLAVQADVEILIANGYGIKLAYKKLVADNKITMSYATFYGYYKKWREKKLAAQDSGATPSSCAPRSENSAIVKSNDNVSSKFIFDPVPDVDRLVYGNQEKDIKKGDR